MNAQELREKYYSAYEYMKNSKDTKNMMVFGRVMTTMVNDMIDSNPSKAEEYICKLEAIKWENYLTEREAEAIVLKMNPQRPWTRDQWRVTMEQHGYVLEEEPYYNRCALYVTMSMIYSDDIESLKHFTNGIDMFEFIHALALNRLKDKDKVFDVRKYFGV